MNAASDLTTLRAHLESRRQNIIDTYITSLTQSNNPLANHPREEIEQAATGLLDAALGPAQPDLPSIGAPIGARRAGQRVPPEASMGAAVHLFNAVAKETTTYAAEHDLDASVMAQVHQDLHRAILRRVVGAALPYASALLRKVSSAHHQERRRIARNLHDHVAHSIAICVQQVQLRDLALERGDPDEAQRRMDLLMAALQEAGELVHDLASELGQFQTGAGFMQALDRFIDLQGTDKVTVNATNTAELESAAPWILEEYFVSVREGISNAIEHAGAENIDVTIGVLDGQARVRIEDDGKGMDLTGWDGPSAGKGLVSLRERVELLGGTARIQSQPGDGTSLDLRVPLIK